MLKRLTNLLTLKRRSREKQPEIGSTPADVVHRENKWRLLHYRPRTEGPAYKTPILLVPSLINRHYVLDLMPGRSFAEWLVGQGHDVYCIDWGTPTGEDRYLTFDDVCETYLGRAVRKVARSSETGKTHLLGYCLGGTLTTIYAAKHQEYLAGHIALAAPINFHDDGLLSRWTRTETFDVDKLVEANGNVPWQLMQGAFHLLRPTMNLSKAVYLVDRAWDDQFLDGFVAKETWANDNVSFPGEAYRRYIDELYIGNKLIAGEFALGGTPVRLEDIENPTLVLAFEHDHIVPADSAAVLVDEISSDDKEVMRLPGGHVGAVVSRKAAEHLWPIIGQWLADRDGRSTPVARAEAAE
ncbi:alpha/beta fold hydrolase [Persicimonas caeni]|uniref:Alpha/beta fold hydrolase n=1 Tax=Persicimonas caeni TaxID=2292766 RepID=A0A4Y6PPJ1_PERCE|nr:alpha/beta fold hydrolase [Persicimonas caeni]QDG50271.1 alpha/beta fold hydrolase [Persicimonas caeni]QED31492.1 alpha/beta fold hydrolase [Persicimonas caeni]